MSKSKRITKRNPIASTEEQVYAQNFVSDQKKPTSTKQQFEHRLCAICGHPSAGNDYRWYSRDDKLLRDACNIPFSLPTGMRFKLGSKLNTSSTELWNDYTVPGIMAFRYTSFPGVSRDGSSPLNRSAVELYAYVRHANSGAANYDPSDLMAYIIGYDSLVAWWAFMQRIYLTARLYSVTNRYLPRGLLLAMGVDPDMIVSQVDQLRMAVNMMRQRIMTLNMPGGINYIKRHAWLNTNVWWDSSSEDERSQCYLYVPNNFWKYTPEAGEGKQPLTYVNWDASDTTHNVDNLINLGVELTNAMVEDESIGIISGDIAKAYGKQAGIEMYDLNYTEENQVLVINHCDEALNQIENMTIWPLNPITITEAPDSWHLICTPSVSIPREELAGYPHNFYNAHSEVEKDPEVIMTGTRLMPVIGDYGGADRQVLAAGTEIVTAAIMYRFDPTNPNVLDSDSRFRTVVPWGNGSVSTHNLLRTLSMLSNFRKHPRCTLLCYAGSEAATAEEWPFYDWDIFTELSNQQLINIHNVSLDGLWYCHGTDAKFG